MARLFFFSVSLILLKWQIIHIWVGKCFGELRIFFSALKNRLNNSDSPQMWTTQESGKLRWFKSRSMKHVSYLPAQCETTSFAFKLEDDLPSCLHLMNQRAVASHLSACEMWTKDSLDIKVWKVWPPRPGFILFHKKWQRQLSPFTCWQPIC